MDWMLELGLPRDYVCFHRGGVKRKVAIMKNRQRGALIGLAVGDALGAAVEFKLPGTFPEVTGYRGGGPHHLKPGEWTDDTSLL